MTVSLHTMSANDPTPATRPTVHAAVVLPLRLFFGIAFVDAGLGKLLSAAWFGPGPQGFAAQTGGFARGSPIGGLVRAVALGHPGPVAFLLAFAELAVGVLTLAGLAARAAAAVALGLSLTFFLTASWHTRPFFYGADLPFAAGWLVLLLAGDAGLPSVDRWLRRRERAATGLAEGPLAGRRDRAAAQDASRRAFLLRATTAGGALACIGVLSGGLAVVAALLGGGRRESDAPVALPGPKPKSRTAARQPSRITAQRPHHPVGTRVGSLDDVPVGQAASFVAPSTGGPALVVRLSATRVVAYGARCTHAGCTVGYDSASRLLACPCHGAEFDPAHGAAVVAGPAPAPLPGIAVRVGPDRGLYVPPA